MVYHVLNRANAQMPIFEKPEDYDAFERILDEAVRRVRMRLLAYCAMPNHWHMVVWPREDGDLSAFVGWLTLTHTQRWHAHRHSVGTGHVHQGRFKSFLVESDEHLWTVCRYVERNALRAGLCACAEEWRWSSIWRRASGDAECRAALCEWPIAIPKDWLRRVNRASAGASWRRYVAVRTEDNPTGVTLGWIALPSDSAWSRPSGPEAVHTRNPTGDGDQRLDFDGSIATENTEDTEMEVLSPEFRLEPVLPASVTSSRAGTCPCPRSCASRR